MNIFQYVNSKLIAKLFASLSYRISYFHNHHKIADLHHPQNLSEIWYKKAADGYYLDYYLLADKYRVRDYVSQKGHADILIPLIGHYSSPAQIDFDKLPNRFALKMNFGAAMNIICQDKSMLDRSSAICNLEKWFKINDYSFTEKHYSLIQKCAICEEFIDDGSGRFPTDYKFMCIHGKVHCILVCSGRENGHADYLPYSEDWKPMTDYYKECPQELRFLKAPVNLPKMIEIAESLAGDIDLVRVDLYSNGSRIWFGEITLTPAGCIFHRWSNKALARMGRIYSHEK
ncbi:ATP-grasp fold amidoligase family protein [Butyricimonas virosa]|uniref:ATP-grasp fold amidoligase family protein n=1 Tax=Butyricimonas virosa TaxID=544645 RepID=UPI002AB080A7|nr:hypothetical protein [Butyricimonas virosa]